jgi:hypothetical protein
MIELIVLSVQISTSNESPVHIQKRALEGSKSVSISKNPTNPSIQTWLPIFQENFEGVTPPALPAGWTATDGDGDGNTWQSYPSGSCSGSVSFTSKFVCYDDDGAGSSNATAYEVLRTPLIYVPSGASAYRLRFDYSFDAWTYAPVETFYVNLRYKSGGGPWNSVRILNLPGTADSLNKTFTFDFTSYMTGSDDTIQIEFVYDDGGDWGWGAGVDNVVVEGNYTLNNDLGIVGVSPNAGVYYFYPSGSTINPIGSAWVKITNTGTNPQSGFTVYLKVNANTYSQTYAGTLNSNQTDSVQFTNVQYVLGTNNIKAWHGLSDDFVGNDTFNTTLSLNAKATDTLNYPNSLTANDAIGSNGNLGNSHEAVRYDSATIWPFVVSADSYYITKIFFYHCSTYDPSSCPGGNTRVSLWLDDGTGKPSLSLEIIGKDTTLPSGTSGAKLWFISLPTPIKIEQAILPFYAGRSWNINATFPFGIDDASTCILNYSCWVRADAISGGAWGQLTDYGLNYSWILGIVVQKKSTGYEEVILPKDAKILRYDNGRIVFNKEIEKDTRIQIYNTNGALVKDIQVSKGTRALKVGKLPKGTYIYIIENKVGKIIVN